MNIAAGNVIINTNSANVAGWINDDVFYTVAENGTVAVWFSDDEEAIQLGARHPGTSGKSAATIANDIYGA
jgi:hypothetical protein